MLVFATKPAHCCKNGLRSGRSASGLSNGVIFNLTSSCLLCVRWYFEFRSATTTTQEMMLERGHRFIKRLVNPGITRSYLDKWERMGKLTWYAELRKYTFDVACKLLVGTDASSEVDFNKSARFMLKSEIGRLYEAFSCLEG